IFREQFTSIAANFSEVFKELFGGGTAFLQLTDEDNILESGIEIIAKPPGKKLQNMTLLSGGERTLTAIALVFGILKLKPSPFCVLDEIEAALDDANVIRFAEYLNSLSQETQFIVITHRKGTMERADTLYGVTMQERGISKVLSIKLEDATEYLDKKSS
ncbi:MAG: AAA family ATPase, partial [Cellulosilyticaceae bacterium]